MGEQLTLPFDAVEEHRRPPTWDDVQKGTAELYTKYEPCDKCESSPMKFYRGGKCTHTSENYAYPKQQPNGMCRRGYLRWVEA